MSERAEMRAFTTDRALVHAVHDAPWRKYRIIDKAPPLEGAHHVPSMSRTYRGFTDGDVVHYVWCNEFLDFSRLCWAPGTYFKTYIVEESTTPVNCLACIAIDEQER